MSLLSPTPSSRPSRGAGGGILSTLLAAVVALCIGVAAGIWWAERDDDDSTTTTPDACASPSATPTYPAPAAVPLNVYNATDRSGLASTTADQMEQRGFPVAEVANDPTDTAVAGTAQVRHGPTGLAGAQLVALNVAASELLADTRTDASVDLVVGDSFQTLVPVDQVQAAIASTPSPNPSCTPSPSAPAATTPAPSP